VGNCGLCSPGSQPELVVRSFEHGTIFDSIKGGEFHKSLEDYELLNVDTGDSAFSLLLTVNP
jgi:hypothetical protein